MTSAIKLYSSVDPGHQVARPTVEIDVNIEYAAPYHAGDGPLNDYS